jgi:hypothetical protein
VEAKAMRGIISGTKKLASLEIVWRNPHRVRACRRRHNLERAGECAVYIMQEFVEDGQTSYWATISGLEVLAGGQAA